MTDFFTLRRNVEKLLKKRAFRGHYVEKRLVNENIGYRDVVWLDPEESELAEDLSYTAEVCRSLSPEMFPSYSTKPEPSIWTSFTDVTLGCHWFQIISVFFTEDMLVLELKSLRYFPNVEFQKPKALSVEINQLSMKQIQQYILDNCTLLYNNINVSTIQSTVKFIFILIIALVGGIFQLLFYLGDFSLKFVHELGLFMQNGTPLMLGFVDFISKIIGGFYILLAMLWRGNTRPVDHQYKKNRTRNRMINYVEK